ncbi:MAG: caspase domain-containing protein [Hyphomicrobiales bacterium]
MIRVGLLASCLALPLTAVSASAELYALVIGIDEYEHLSDLQGAVNDASDIADAVAALDPTEVRVLLNGAATREAIYTNWNELVAKASPGDTLLITYAGHGGNEPATYADDEDNARDENILLSGFDRTGLPAAQRIRDDEIAALIAQRPEVDVIFVADSCHSGSVHRKLTGRARFSPITEIIDDPLPRPTQITLPEFEDGYSSVFFGAVPETDLVYEITEGDQVRGALSLAFANGIRGAADRNGDGEITKGELEEHIRRTVSRRTGGNQFPVVQPSGQIDETLFVLNQAADPADSRVNPFATAFDDLPAVPLEIINAPTPDMLYPALAGISPVTDQSERLTWDVEAGMIFSQQGEMLSRLSVDVRTNAAAPIKHVQRVIDKMRIARHLHDQGLTRELTLSFKSGYQRYREGDRVLVSLEDRSHDFPVLFNLASNGIIQFLYPDPRYKDREQIRAAESLDMTFYAVEPFGADHLVAIETAQPVPALLRSARLRHRDTTNVRAFWTDLHFALKDQDPEFAVFPYFTTDGP